MAQKTKNLYANFYDSLEKEYKYLSHGGTNYRVKTAELSLAVAKRYTQLQPFLNRTTARVEVRKHFPEMDEERLNDVSKMLVVNAKEVDFKARQTPEFRRMVRNRMKKARNYKLVRVKK